MPANSLSVPMAMAELALPEQLRRSWVEVDCDALTANLAALRSLLPSDSRLGPVVKSNAYGHGMLLAAEVFVRAGADWLCVDSLHEAWTLRQHGFELPIFVAGHVPPEQAEVLAECGCRAVVYLDTQIDAFARAAQLRGVMLPLHIKIETGTHRQGLELDAAIALGRRIAATPGLRLEGISTHFANVEDTTDHRFALAQLASFEAASQAFAAAGLPLAVRSIANSAATILWRHAHFELVRPGISAYGMWPSKESYLSAMLAGRGETRLRPALRWLTRIAQIKDVPVGASVGYGCTYQTTHPSRIAVIPVGYYDGYDRELSNVAHVLVHGQRAPVRGRICMNMAMIDVTDIGPAQVGDEVVLLGRQGTQQVSAEQLADWAGTINYEVTTRILEAIPRLARAGATP